VTLLFINHLIDKNGKFVIENTPCHQAQKRIDHLSETMNKQSKRLNEKYQINEYHNNQLRMCVVSNSYNNFKNGLLYRNLDSIFQQDYTNYHIVYTDDNSDDKTGEHVKEHIQSLNNGAEVKVLINNKKVGMMENIYKAVTYHCQAGEIAIMLDGDDALIGRNVFSLVNAIYQK
jgi:cellulose synthase/poly-beta-1,6-N-acetylglucosamine synthase-like glycosyltransferase